MAANRVEPVVRIDSDIVIECDQKVLTGEKVSAILNHMVQYSKGLDSAFSALSDSTRRGILERLGRSDTAISELADDFRMTLTGIKKHVKILEAAGLVTTEKIGRVRHCRLGQEQLDDETAWMAKHRRMLEARLNRLEDFLERTKGT